MIQLKSTRFSTLSSLSIEKHFRSRLVAGFTALLAKCLMVSTCSVTSRAWGATASSTSHSMSALPLQLLKPIGHLITKTTRLSWFVTIS